MYCHCEAGSGFVACTGTIGRTMRGYCNPSLALRRRARRSINHWSSTPFDFKRMVDCDFAPEATPEYIGLLVATTSRPFLLTLNTREESFFLSAFILKSLDSVAYRVRIMKDQAKDPTGSLRALKFQETENHP
jgi:hypothetical protein